MPFRRHQRYIYNLWKNGSGKTTLSNTIELDGYKKYIFGSEFIRKNIYISNELEEKSTNTNAINLTNFLLVDEKTIDLQIKIEQLSLELKEVPKYSFDTKYTEILGNVVDERKLEHLDSILKSADKCIISADYFDSLIEEYEENCSIKSQSEFEEKLLIIKNNVIAKTFIDELNSTGIAQFIDNIENLNTIFNRYNTLVEDLKEINSYVGEGTEIENWKRLGLRFHKEAKVCHFCKSKLSEDYENMRLYYEDKKIQALHKLEAELTQVIEKINHLTSNPLYSKDEAGLKNEIRALTTLKQDLESVYIQVNGINKIENNVLFKPIKFLSTENDLLDIYQNMISYLTNSQLKEYLEYEIKIRNIKEQIGFYKILLDDLYNETIDNDVIEINSCLKQLDLDEEIVLSINNMGGKKKIKLDLLGEKTIQKISEGEKHKLALAVFMAKLKKSNLENCLIIFDDPVITLDVQTYFRFRDYIKTLISHKLSSTNSKLIILSHNIHYLYVQTSNLSSKHTFLSFYKMQNNGLLTEQSIDFIKMDDYSFLNHALNIMQSEEEFVLLFPMIKKMYRHSIDLVSRMNGVPIIITEISKILIELENRDVITNDERSYLQTFSNKLSVKVKKDSNHFIKIGTMKGYITEFNRAMTILKIPFSIKIDTTILDSFNDNHEVNLFEDTDYRDITFDMLQKLAKMVVYNQTVGEANYLAHPNNQVTNSLVAFDFN